MIHIEVLYELDPPDTRVMVVSEFIVSTRPENRPEGFYMFTDTEYIWKRREKFWARVIK